MGRDVGTKVNVERDGIRMTPDAFYPTLGEIDSYKNSWRKMPVTQAEFEDKFWKWVAQEASYCYTVGVDTARWIVLWNRGNYVDIRGPIVMEATAKWSADELAENWRVVLEHNKSLDNLALGPIL